MPRRDLLYYFGISSISLFVITSLVIELFRWSLFDVKLFRRRTDWRTWDFFGFVQSLKGRRFKAIDVAMKFSRSLTLCSKFISPHHPTHTQNSHILLKVHNQRDLISAQRISLNSWCHSFQWLCWLEHSVNLPNPIQPQSIYIKYFWIALHDSTRLSIQQLSDFTPQCESQ